MSNIIIGRVRKLLHKWFIWELIALGTLVGTVGAHASLPLLDSFFLGVKPNEIVIRMYTKEAGGFDPQMITLTKGEPVKLITMSMDVTHSLVIPAFDVDTGPVHAGFKKVIEFTPTQVGLFEFYCNSICSPMHPFMIGLLEAKQG